MALPGNAAGFPIVSREDREETRARRGGGAAGGVHWGAGVLFSAKPCESSPALSENYNCTFLIFCALLLTVVID